MEIRARQQQQQHIPMAFELFPIRTQFECISVSVVMFYSNKYMELLLMLQKCCRFAFCDLSVGANLYKPLWRYTFLPCRFLSQRKSRTNTNTFTTLPSKQCNFRHLCLLLFMCNPSISFLTHNTFLYRNSRAHTRQRE